MEHYWVKVGKMVCENDFTEKLSFLLMILIFAYSFSRKNIGKAKCMIFFWVFISRKIQDLELAYVFIRSM